jgi:hypothetical protein
MSFPLIFFHDLRRKNSDQMRAQILTAIHRSLSASPQSLSPAFWISSVGIYLAGKPSQRTDPHSIISLILWSIHDVFVTLTVYYFLRRPTPLSYKYSSAMSHSVVLSSAFRLRLPAPVGITLRTITLTRNVFHSRVHRCRPAPPFPYTRQLSVPD